MLVCMCRNELLLFDELLIDWNQTFALYQNSTGKTLMIGLAGCSLSLSRHLPLLWLLVLLNIHPNGFVKKKFKLKKKEKSVAPERDSKRADWRK